MAAWYFAVWKFHDGSNYSSVFECYFQACYSKTSGMIILVQDPYLHFLNVFIKRRLGGSVS